MGNSCNVLKVYESRNLEIPYDAEQRTLPDLEKLKKPTLTVSILLLGPAESGKSTLLKQLRVSL